MQVHQVLLALQTLSATHVLEVGRLEPGRMVARLRMGYGQPVKNQPILEESDIGDRLDVVLVRRVPGVSRRRAQYLIGAEIALVNGAAATKSTRLCPGDAVSLTEHVGPDFVPTPKRLASVTTISDDDWACAISKPRGIACFGADEGELDTVAGHLVALFPDAPELGIERRRAGLVNVLEKNVSGVMLAAHTARAFDVIRNHFFNCLAWAEITLLARGTTEETIPFVRIGRQSGGIVELSVVLEPGAQWPLRLTRPLLPQLRVLVSPLNLTLLGDGDSDSEAPAVHLSSLSVSHRYFSAGGMMPLPADWPLPPDVKPSAS